MKNTMKKNSIKRAFTAILSSVALVTAFMPWRFAADSIHANASEFTQSNAESDDSFRTEKTVIEEIITNYGGIGIQAEDKVNDLLNELTGMDSRQGKLWTDIMEYWKYVDTELEVNVDSLPDQLPEDNTMAFAVLGYKLNDDGTMQDELVERLKVALSCAEQYPNAYVICTGGGTAKNNPDVTEGAAMSEWMLAHGLDADRLIVEDQSRTTAENALNSYEILLNEYPQVDSIVLISSSYHIARGTLLFESAFMQAASEKNTPEIHVISNCSCLVENAMYQNSDALRMEAGSMLQMIGSNELAMQYLFGRKPAASGT